ncbi:hypothetical protein GCM10011575_34430 [Microlunatus endophyticus]|uniref:Uncharacterized protein n=1 Tax=Microlunatus endophyticus TaxID=1716077 RepID=A0A917SCY0_9ACTN|nr:hypothetical protein [Microlunatus endophyticus]GGL73215.1 hypothetical protein GCM10011575_34430 [Microlunatus endophyticus]
MSINSPGDYLVHNPAGRFIAVPVDQPAQQSEQQCPEVLAKSGGSSLKRLLLDSLRRR